ncbi:MAG TPA: hypothetical protein VMT85_21365 [Thermoanaerobaculia bacterium]|nr:hypothetical protein [Thermoanaerobaculia bacterium]
MSTSAARLPRIVPGYNHDIPYRGLVYHVQTELLQTPRPHIGTQVYFGGQILDVERTFVDEARFQSRDELDDAMTAQHRRMIRRLVSGQLSSGELTRSVAARSAGRLGAAAPSLSGDPAGRGLALRRNLELRRSVAMVARAVRADEPPGPEQALARLGEILSSMTDIAVRHPYRESRHDELAELLMLRSETLAWLPESGESGAGAMRLWERFVAVSRAFEGINRRSDVVDHDRETWASARRALGELGDDEPVPGELIETLRTTWGRHRALDGLLDFSAELRAGMLRLAIFEALDALDEEVVAPPREQEVADRRRRPMSG